MNNGEHIIRILIVDDEPLARTKIRRFLDDEHGVDIVGECRDGEEAVKTIIEEHPDLVFLDINMPGLDGIGVLETVGTEQMPLVVFVTAYDQFAIKAFELHALDYLLKPFNRGRFQAALSRARRRLQAENANRAESRTESFHSVLSFLDNMRKKENYLNRLMVKDDEKMAVLDVDEIKWLESDRNYIDIHAGEKKYRVRETLGNLEKRLEPTAFVRVNRSTIVNTSYIKELQPLFKKEFVIILKTGDKLILNKNYYPRLEAALNS